MGFVSNKEEEANKCLKEMDLDGDGRVSFAEFARITCRTTHA